jgi:hypothetical protein
MARWKAKIEGCDVSTFNVNHATYRAIAFDILGIFPTFQVESETQTSMNGTQIGKRKFRTVLEIDCIPFSTWDYQRITTTEATKYLIDEILSKNFCRIATPNPANGERLPDRYSDSTNFPKTSGLLPFNFAKCDIQIAQQWGSGNEKLTLTCYAKSI